MKNINPHCRISKVRPKASPHLVEIIPEKRGMEFLQKMRNYTEIICDLQKDKGIAGFAMVAWGFDGCFSRGSATHPDSFIGTTLMPSFVAEVLRRDVAADVATDIVQGEI